MTREEYLKFCKVCTHRKMDMNRGLICNLTNEIADFDSQCSNYEIDEVENKKLASRSDIEAKTTDSGFFGSWKSALLLSALGFVRAASKGFDDILGIIFFILGIGWLIIAFTRNNNK